MKDTATCILEYFMTVISQYSDNDVML